MYYVKEARFSWDANDVVQRAACSALDTIVHVAVFDHQTVCQRKTADGSRPIRKCKLVKQSSSLL